MRPLLAAQSDERLVALTRAGNERAFEAIVHRYRAPLVRYAGRILPASRAEDAVQQAFMSAYEALGRSGAAIDLKPWLYKITHNASLNLLRQNGWDYDQIPPDFDGVMRPDQAVELGERLRITVRAVKELPDRQRDAIVLRELEGRSYEEIAAALGTGDGAVRQLLNRARSTMRAAVTAVTPWPLVARAATSPTGANVERAMEVAGAAGLIKVGVATLATAAVVGGSVAGPIDLTGDPPRAPKPAEAVAAPADEKESPATTATETTASSPARTDRSRNRRRGHDASGSGRHVSGGRDDEHEREDRSGPGRDDDDERKDRSGPGRDDDEREREAGSDDEREAEVETEAERDNSGPGSGGDDDVTETAEDNSGSGSGSVDDVIPTTEAQTLRTDNSGPGSIDAD